MVLTFLVKFSWNYVLDIPEHILRFRLILTQFLCQ
jgi:hypothetical protein